MVKARAFSPLFSWLNNYPKLTQAILSLSFKINNINFCCSGGKRQWEGSCVCTHLRWLIHSKCKFANICNWPYLSPIHCKGPILLNASSTVPRFRLNLSSSPDSCCFDPSNKVIPSNYVYHPGLLQPDSEVTCPPLSIMLYGKVSVLHTFSFLSPFANSF